ncbi:MAG TPA: transglycosylase domain-containing protein [Streptosporangiaceae bacterium]
MLISRRRAGLRAAGVLVVVSAAAGLLVGAILVPVVGAIGVGARNAAKTFNTLSVPSLGQLPSRSEIVDSAGRLIAYYYPNSIDRVPVSFHQIAPVMRQAIIAIEDARFYDHGAFDLRGTVRALVNDLQNNEVQGGSTLAQQYVKNALILTAKSQDEQREADAPTATRKIRELRMASIVSRQLTKNQLLAAYLNVAYFENGARGIQVAAERYFGTSAKKLTLTQSALLAGIVEFPSAYNPIMHPHAALQRRNEVLGKMADQHLITTAQASTAQQAPLGLHIHNTSLESGCTSHAARRAAFFCDYVLAALRVDPAYRKAYKALNTVGGLTIHTTLNPADQRAAQHAVNFVEPAHGSANPGGNADTEVLITPGTGKLRAIAVDRPYGNGPGQTTVDYAATKAYDGGVGVQTGSSSKLFTLLTALKQDVPFGFNMKVSAPVTLTGYYNCHGDPITTPFTVHNAEGPGKGIFTLYNGTTGSINAFFAQLERKVGLCNVVKTAVSLGMTRGDGSSLLRQDPQDKHNLPADDIASFTLGSVQVAPMSMAAAYATVAARGVYCKPIAIAKIVTARGKKLPVASPHCHRVLSKQVADAANFILQGVLTTGTAGNRGIGRPAAAKTGTADEGFYAAFAGFTPTLAGYVSVFNPVDPTTGGKMLGPPHSCYREVSGLETCPAQMFGDDAPGATWQYTFLRAALGKARAFVAVPSDSLFFRLGNGFSSPKPKKHGKPHPGPGGPGPGGPGGGGGGGGPGPGGGGGPPPPPTPPKP